MQSALSIMFFLAGILLLRLLGLQGAIDEVHARNPSLAFLLLAVVWIVLYTISYCAAGIALQRKPPTAVRD